MTPTTVRRARFNHGAAVSAFVSDDEVLVTGGVDGRIRIWDRLTGFVRHVIKAHDTKLTGLALTGRLVVSGDDRGYAAISNIDSGETTRRHVFGAAHGWPIRSVAASVSGKVAFAAGHFEQRHDIYGDRDDPPQVRVYDTLDEIRALSTGYYEGARGKLAKTFDDRSVVPHVRFVNDELDVDVLCPPFIDPFEGLESTPAVERVRIESDGAVSVLPKGEAASPIPPATLERIQQFPDVFQSWWGAGPMAVFGDMFAQTSRTEVLVRRLKDGYLLKRIKTGFAVTALGFRADGALVVLESNADTVLRINENLGVKRLTKTVFELDGRASCLDIRDNLVAIGFTDGSVVTVSSK